MWWRKCWKCESWDAYWLLSVRIRCILLQFTITWKRNLSYINERKPTWNHLRQHHNRKYYLFILDYPLLEIKLNLLCAHTMDDRKVVIRNFFCWRIFYFGFLHHQDIYCYSSIGHKYWQWMKLQLNIFNRIIHTFLRAAFNILNHRMYFGVLQIDDNLLQIIMNTWIPYQIQYCHN